MGIIKFFLSFFVNTERITEIVEENQQKIETFSQKNLYLGKTVKTGFRLWSWWKLLLWLWIIFLLVLGGGILIFLYVLFQKFFS